MANRDYPGSGNSNALLAGAMVAAAAIISWGGTDEPRYQLASSDSAVYRMDTDSGEVIACVPSSCRRVELPDRAKSFGPFSFSIGGGKEAERQVAVQRQVERAQNVVQEKQVEQLQP
jgi:hypothetical protein